MAQSPRGGPTEGSQAPSPADSEEGFKLIFDGKTLAGWDGNTAYWRAESGELIGEVTADHLLEQNSFIIWRGGKPRNFELKAEYRVSDLGNSGINYHSVELRGRRWALRGPQADIDGQNLYTGQNYEERGRALLARRGDATEMTSNSAPRIIATLGSADALRAFIKVNDWNEYHLIVRGNLMIHILNGHLMSEVIDDDRAHRRATGLIGVQVHVGPPMKIEFRHLRLRTLDCR